MSSILMEVEESSVVSENSHIAGLESQILNSQEIIVRLNRELDSALLRITSLEDVCSQTQNDLHDKRSQIQQLNDDIIEQEETNDRLLQELQEKDDKLKVLDELIIQLKQHIKQTKQETEEEKEIDYDNKQDRSFADASSITDQQSQIIFDQELRQLILQELNDDNSLNRSPQALIDQYHNNERLKFHDLLQKSLIAEDISNLIDSDDILFELLTHLNSLSRLKDTLSRDSKQYQHIRSLLHLTNDDNHDELIKDLINKRECIEYLRTKIDHNDNLTDFDLMKYVLHDYFNFQQQQIDLQDYLHLTNDKNNEINYSRLLIERCSEAVHVEIELNEHIKNHQQTIEQLNNQLNEHINEAMERRKEIDNIVSKFNHQSINEDTNEVSQLDRIRTTLQSNIDFQHALSSAMSLTSTEDILQRVHEYKSIDDNRQISSDQDQQLIINELTQEIHELKEEIHHRKNQFKQLTNLLQSDNDDETTEFNLIHSSLQESTDFRHTLSKKLSVIDSNESIIQCIDDYQLIINQLNSQENNNWTNETAEKLITKLKTMEDTIHTIDDLQEQLDEAIDNEKQLQSDIEEIADEFTSKTNDEQRSNLTRIYHLLQSLTDFHRKISDKTQMNTDEEILQSLSKYQEKQVLDAESQTIDNDDFYLQIKQLIGVEQDNSEEIINKIKELLQLPSQTDIDELFRNNEKLRNVLNIKDDNLVKSVMNSNEQFLQLKQNYDLLVTKEDNIDKSIEKLTNKLGSSSEASSQIQIDEICAIFDRFCFEYSQLTSTDIKILDLMEVFNHIRLVIEENNQFKELINQINDDKSSEDLNYLSTLHTYVSKVDTLCQLISHDNVTIDQALIIYEEKIQHHKNTTEKISAFKQQLLTRLFIDNEEQIFDRLNELHHINNDLTAKLQTIDDSSNTLISLHKTVTEQSHKIIEHEETLEKLRGQRERMLNKMKEMKTNNETLTDQFKQVNQSLDEQYRKEINYKNQLEELEQQLRSANNQIQVTLDECQTQQDLQETMKLEITSIQQENEIQRKLYESRCRQIINEKNQLDKNKKDLIEQKQLLEDENKQLQTIFQTIKDILENVDDIKSIPKIILKLQQDHMRITRELHQHDEQMNIEKEKLLLNINQRQSINNEYIQIKNELETRLFDNEKQIINLKQELKENIEKYQHLQNEYQTYQEDNEITKNAQVAVIDIEQSLPSAQSYIVPIQQTTESNKWMTIDMTDEKISSTPTIKHSSIDTATALFNFLGELKSKLGITLTHRPRSSSVYFLYLCAVHFLTIYLLFIRHC